MKTFQLIRIFLLSLIVLAAFSIESSGQKSKREEIYRNKLFKDYVDVNYYYDNKNIVTSKQIMLYGQDLRYQQIVELVTIYFGSPKDFMKFIEDVEIFCNENEPDVSSTIDGRIINVVKQSGIKGFYLYEKDGSGYRGYNMKTWRKIKKSFIEWADKTNEPLK